MDKINPRVTVMDQRRKVLDLADNARIFPLNSRDYISVKETLKKLGVINEICLRDMQSKTDILLQNAQSPADLRIILLAEIVLKDIQTFRKGEFHLNGMVRAQQIILVRSLIDLDAREFFLENVRRDLHHRRLPAAGLAE